MKKNMTRRSFITTGTKAGISATLMAAGLPAIAGKIRNSAGPIGYIQQPLPYAFTALEPVIDGTTMNIHYTKHAAGYTKNLADACVAEKVDTGLISLEQLLRGISKYSVKMRNNGGGHYNHEFFWQCMQSNATEPGGNLLSSIQRSFGSLEAMKNQFTDAGKNRFGSGWAWLIMTPDRNLAIGSTPNQDNPLMDISDIKGTPLLALDVWEHAYYLNYQNRRADYITNWWKIVNWNFVQQNFDKV